MTETTPTRVNGHADPKVKLLKVATEPDQPAATEAEEQPSPAPAQPARRRVRVDSLRRILTATRPAWRHATRHAAYTAGGAGVLTRRAWESRTTARYDRMMRIAEAAGNTEELREWEQRAADYRRARQQRRLELLQMLITAPKALLTGTAAGTGLLLLVGALMAWHTGDLADVLTPLTAVVDLVGVVATIAAIVWNPLLYMLPWLALAAAWAVGRAQHTAPAWALPAQHRSDDDAPVTPSVVVTALRDLGIAALRKAIEGMGDMGAALLSPIVIAGCGVEVDVHLPSGVSTEEIQNKRRKLAENLGRHEHEVFITIPEAARTVRLWIADSGALNEPIGPSPLVLDDTLTADYKTGRAPWGQSLRGDAVALSIYQRHLLCTGLSNQGKTAALRALALWLAFDPKVKFWIGDLKGHGDWAMFDGLADVLIQGPTDEHACAVTEMVEAGVTEMERRLQAPDGTVHDPLVIVVDEAQVAFMNPLKDDNKLPYGGKKATSRYFMACRRIHNQGRAVSLTLWQGTQDPTDENLPKLVREGAHIRASLVVGSESQAAMALGEKAVNAGAAPHLLRQGLDKGTVVVAGDGIDVPAGQPAITVRTHFIDDGPAVEIAERAKARRSGVSTAHTVEAAEPVNHLADIAQVLGDEPRVRTPEVLHRLKNLNEAVYGGWDGGRLRKVLTDAGGDTGTYQGYPVVARKTVLQALADQAENDG